MRSGTAGRYASTASGRYSAPMTEPAPTYAVSNDPEAERLEIRVDGELAGYLEYRRLSGRIAYTHTEVDPRFKGGGVGGRLVRAGLELARSEGVKAVPLCPFFKAWVARHPEEAAPLLADPSPF